MCFECLIFGILQQITHPLPKDSTAFAVEEYVSSLVQTLEHDSTDDHNDESILNNQAIDSCCSTKLSD